MSLALDLYLNANAYLDRVGSGASLVDGYARGRSAFGATVSLPTAGPAFLLAAGDSVNSIAAGVVDGSWTGTPVSVAAVPLPAPLWGMLGAAPLLWRRRSRPVEP